MKVLVVSHYFPPEPGAPQARLSELAAAWAASGHDVTVLTGLPNHPTGVVPLEYRRGRRRETVDGYAVVRTWLFATPNEGVLKKTVGHLSFMVTSAARGLRLPRADVVVVSSPTFFSALSAWIIAKVKRSGFVVEVRDLWPAIFVELGVIRSRTLIAVLERLELALYGAADLVVVVTEGFRTNLIERGVPSEKVHTIRNGVDLGRFVNDEPRRDDVRARLGAGPDDVLVLYLGAHGVSHGLTSVADAAAKLQDRPIRFAFVGDGAARDALVQRIAALALENVVSLTSVPRDEVPAILAASDICLAPLRDVPLFTSFIPSKIFEYLAGGRPVIGALKGEAAGILREAGAVVVEPEDPAELAEAVSALAADADRRRVMGAAGRRFVVERFDRQQLADDYERLLHRVVRGLPAA